MFLVMQLVDGAPIDRWARERRAAPAAVVAAFRQAGLGVVAAHAAGLVHRDIKPSNILVDAGGTARVGDFGIARAVDDAGGASASHSHIIGTPAYMAPEQLAGHATAASDQYAFCCALWEVLSGEVPRDAAALRRAADVPAYVERAVRRGLDADPAARFPSMAALVGALAPPRARRRAMLAGAAAVTIAAAAAAVVVATSHGDDGAAPAEPAAGPRLPVIGPLVRPLTHYGATACAYSPAITDDGEVVFDRTEGDNVDLYAVPLAGGEPAQLTTASTWEWHSNPGGSAGEIVYVITDSRANASSVATLDLATRSGTVLANVGARDVAAAGGIVYYVADRPELRRLDHGRDENVASLLPDGTPIGLAASRDGAELAALAIGASSLPQMCTFEVATRRTHCAPVEHAGGGRPAFSSDGRAIYYGGVGLRRLDLATDGDALLIPGVSLQGGVAVSPDGSELVVSLCSNTSRLVDASASPPSVVVDDDDASQPTYARDGTLAYLSHPDGVAVVMVRDRAGTTRQVSDARIRGIRGPAISPDGEHVAFTTGSPRPGIVVVTLARPGSSSPLTDDATDVTMMWLDDGTLAFARSDGAGGQDVFVMHLADSKPRRVARGCVPAAVRRGELLVTCERRTYWLDPATGRERAFTQELGDDVAIGTASPSGRWLALAYGQLDQTFATLDLDDPNARPHTAVSLPSGQTLDGFAVTDDGHVVLAIATWSGDLVVLSAVGGTRF